MSNLKPDAEGASRGSRSAVGGKQSFDHIYNHPDPRPYYRTLQPLDYQVAEHARPIFERCLRTLARTRGKRQLAILDLCCGYGVNGGLLRHRLGMADLYDRYGDPDLDRLGSEELAKADRRFYEEHRRDEGAAQALVGSILGLDPAERAVSYAERTGLIDRGAAINLEREDLPAELRRDLAEVDLITVTGGMGYVTEVTFRKILSATRPGARPWIVSFPLRGLDLTPFERVFDEYGLVCETWEEDLIPQRRFADESERRRTLQRLEDNGLDSDPERESGRLLALCCLARPAAEKVALAELMNGHAQSGKA